MYAFTLRSFSDGFKNYVEKTESQKLMPFVNALSSIYFEQGDWEWINTEGLKWHSLIEKYIDEINPDHAQVYGRVSLQDSLDGEWHRIQLNIDSHIYLKDKLNQLIIGNPTEINAVHWIPIKKTNEILGYLGYIKENTPSNRLETLFLEEQQRNFLLIALSLIFISAVVALPAAILFLRPLNRVRKMLAEIAKGYFTKRLPVIRHDEIGDLSKDLNSLAITLEKKLQTRQQWVADISHELRTPVSILKGEIDAIQDGIRVVTETTLTSFQHEIERLTILINDLQDLALSDIGALSFKKQALDFYALLQERLDTQENNLQQRSFKVTINCPNSPINIIGDAKRLEQLIDNLLQNSIRYTDDLGLLTISLTEDINSTTLLWEDSSPGVDDQDLAKLIEPLYRAEPSRNRNMGGSGLGLAICKNIVEAHQGTFSVEHSELGGIAIRIILSNQS